MVLVVGVDAGGTASKAVVTGADGVVLGRGDAGPGNPSATGTAAVRAIGSALRSALGGRDAGSVAAGVVGVAGVSALADPGVAAAFAQLWAALGLGRAPRVVGDAVTALAAGTDAASGRVLICGTGAVAALVEDLAVTRHADGLGWLLGDEGSGVWLGLAAVRHSVRRFSTPLAREVAAHAGVATFDALVRWAQALPPFSALAPIVCKLADAGDGDAAAIVHEGATRLIATLDALDAPDTPVVLAGGLLVSETPMRRAVLEVLTARGTQVGTAADPALGAARLALRLHREVAHR